MLRTQRIRIGKRYTFEAAHSLPNHDGACRNLHGHSYILEVEVEGPRIESGAKRGMVIDYADLDSLVKAKVIDVLDHSFLNEGPVAENLDTTGDTTAENIAVWCFDVLLEGLEGWNKATTQDVLLHSVRVRETAKSWAEVRTS